MESSATIAEKLLSQQPARSSSAGRAVELQPQSVAEKSTCCPLCGKAGIRLVAFTDAAGILHIIVAGPMPCDSS
jgi:hypothetical protein